MNNAAIKTLVVDAIARLGFLRIEADCGGLLCSDEATLEWKASAARGAKNDLAPLLIERAKIMLHNAVDALLIAQPDICRFGAISRAQKIAAIREPAGIGMAPHNPQGLMSSSAAWGFPFSTPVFVIQEGMSDTVPWCDVVCGPLRREDSEWLHPEVPGLGVAVNAATCAQRPYAPEVQHSSNAVLPDLTIVD